MKGSKLCWMYDGKRDELMGTNWDCGMDLDLGLGTGDAMDGLKMANMGFLFSGRQCKVWIGRFCKSYYSSSSRREIIMGLLLRDVRDVVIRDSNMRCKCTMFLQYLSNTSGRRWRNSFP